MTLKGVNVTIKSLTFNKQLIAKGSSADQRLGGFFAWSAFSIVGVDRDPNYVVVPALKGPTGQQVWRKSLGNNQGVNPFAFSMTAVNKHPELTMKDRYINRSRLGANRHHAGG